jgi:hypothetical protein
MPENAETRSRPDEIEMPRPTVAPLILALGIVLLGAGVALSLVLSAVGAVVFAVGLGVWIFNLTPGRGHFHEPRALPSRRPQIITPTAPGMVEQMQAGMPGYRMRLPIAVQPISAGIKGGIFGGLVMPFPAVLWGLISGHGIWYPINLLAGMVTSGVQNLSTAELEQFRFGLLLVGIVIHAVMSLVLGLMYGVLLPALPPIRGGQFAWGGVLLPLLWTGASYGLMGVVNPLLEREVNWPWFILSQFAFGITASIVVIRTEKIPIPPKGMGPDTASLTH